MKYLTTDLDRIKWVRHGFFTRAGGVSGGIYESLNCGIKTEDDRANIQENRTRAAASMGVPFEQLVIARQVHGIEVVNVAKPWPFGNAPDGDGLVTAERGIALGVLTADCAPVLFADRQKKVIGACHAGWKGALNGVLEETVAAMEKLGAAASHIEAAIGPCIGPQVYEVRDDFMAQFLAVDAESAAFFREAARAGHRIFDLPGYVGHRLRRRGVQTVYDTRQDTATQEKAFFSNRRAFLRGEKGFGLQVSIIAMA
jgi:YfiH family protein